MNSQQNTYLQLIGIATLILVLLLISIIVFFTDNSKSDWKDQQKADAPLAKKTDATDSIQIETPLPAKEIVAASPTTNAGHLINTVTAPVIKAIEDKITVQRVLIQDVIGNPIKDGTLTFGTKEQKFENGEAGIDFSSLAGKQQITASAIGYASSSITIEIPSAQAIPIHLDYLCNFAVKVYFDHALNKPAAGAKVILRKQQDVLRPVEDHVEIPEQNFIFMHEGMKIQRTAEQIIIKKGNKSDPSKNLPGDVIDFITAKWSNASYTDAFFINSDMKTYLSMVSPLLRLWDSLAIISKLHRENPEKFYLTYDNKKNTFNAMFDNNFKTDSEWLKETQTDANGMACFTDIPAGMYSAQAFWQKGRSAIVTFLPGCDKNVTFLSPAAMVVVWVFRPGSNIKALSAVADAVITLKSMEQNSSAIVTKPADKMGLARFDKIPYGKYQLTVKPPSETNLPEKVLEVDVTDFSNQYYIQYDAIGGCRIAGKVVRTDTNEPVAGYPLELYRVSDPGGIFTTVTTALDGTFAFEKVPEGKYSLSYNGAENINFLPAGEFIIPQGYFKTGQTIIVKDADIENIIYAVLPVVKTVLKGIVLDSNGIAQKDAVLESKSRKIIFSNQESLSKPDGSFELSFITTAEKEELEDILLATLYEPRKEEENITGIANNIFYAAGRSDSSKADEISDSPVKAKGETPFHCKIGSTVDGIKIIVSETDMGAVHGTIITKSACKINSIIIMQNARFMKCLINSDQTFESKGLVPGKFRIDVKPDQETIHTEKYGDQRITRYCYLSKDFVFPEGQKTMQCDISLYEAGQIFGYLYDKNKDPIANTFITCFAGDENNPDSHGITHTEKNGFFWVHGLRKDLPHQLRVSKQIMEKGQVIMNNLRTDGPEVIIRLE